MRKMLALCAAMVAVPLLGLGQGVLVNQSFKGDEAGWRKSGWSFKDAYFKSVDGCLQVKADKGERRFMLLDVPVETGQCYKGSIMVKAVDVRSRDNRDRGATLFFGFLAADRSWINGGEFPRGAYGTGDWRKIEIGSTVPVPQDARFIQVWVGIEGQGTALFKDFVLSKVDLSTNLTIDSTKNPPSFSYNSPMASYSSIKMRLNISLSQNPSFPEGETFNEIVSSPNKYTWPHALKPGKWYMKAFWVVRSRYTDMTGDFVVNGLPEGFIAKVTWDFPQGTFAAKPAMKVSFYPELTSKPVISLNGKPVKMLSFNGKTAEFEPSEALASGIYKVKVVANGHESSHIFVNKAPAHKFTFRDDMMLMIDGKPFFPVGTYRDITDKRDVFDSIHEAGFNTTHTYDFEHKVESPEIMKAYLKDCAKQNLMTFFGIPRVLLREERTDELMRYCAEIYDEPALLTYYLADEPTGWINPYSFKLGADSVKVACPGVPRTLLMCTLGDKEATNRFYGNNLSEIFWHDPYPIPSHPIESVKSAMEISRRTTTNRQSIWAVIQAFDWDQRKVKDKKPEDVEPKAGKIRCMTHLALAADVQGIIFYWLPGDRYHMKVHSPIQWAEVCATTKELNSLMPFLVGHNAPQQVKLPAGVDYWCRTDDNGKYAIAAINYKDKPVEFLLEVPGFRKNVSLKPFGVEVNVFGK